MHEYLLVRVGYVYLPKRQAVKDLYSAIHTDTTRIHAIWNHICYIVHTGQTYWIGMQSI